MIKVCGTASSYFAVAASALRTRPDGRAWRETLMALALFALLAGLASALSEAFTFSLPTGLEGVFPLIPVVFIVPALFEEMVFRISLPALTGGTRLADALALGLFIPWHPVQVWLGLPLAQPLFLDPVFLTLAGLLGLSCAILYRRSGSVWPAVILHGGVVAGWKLLFV